MEESRLWTSSYLQAADGRMALSVFWNWWFRLLFLPKMPQRVVPKVGPRPAVSPGNWLEMGILRPNPDLLNPQLWVWEPHPVIWAF